MSPEDEAVSAMPQSHNKSQPSWWSRLTSWLTPTPEAEPVLPSEPSESVAPHEHSEPVLPSEPSESVAPHEHSETVLPSELSEGAAPREPSEPSPASAVRDPLRHLEERLSLEEVDDGLAQSLVQELLSERPREKWTHDVEVFSAAARVLLRWVSVTGPLKLNASTPTIIALIGPTGVGKSTTLAKMAALAAHKDKNSVGLVSTDTRRIGAVEQIRVYARLLGLPLAVVRSTEELGAALSEFAHRDLVFVDTAGQSPNELERVYELESLLHVEQKISRFLAVSATTKQSDLRHILESFDSLGYDGVIVTKLDESRSHGILLNVSHWSGRPLVCLGVGQGVPGDVEVASRERVVDLVLDLSGRFPGSREKT